MEVKLSVKNNILGTVEFLTAKEFIQKYGF